MPTNTHNLPAAQWRLIHTPPASGAWNMALDSAILEAVGRGSVLPTLRFYAWYPPCLSLGYAQPIRDIDRARLDSLGWDIVRRPTGGRAILHTDELTYSVTGPEQEPRLIGGVLASYQRLSLALVEGLRTLGLRVQATSKNKPDIDRENAVCFEHPSHYEITVEGKKLIGSAQARKKEGVLQHGTLPLYGDLTRITNALHFPSEGERSQAAKRLLAKATNVETILGYRINWEDAAQAFATAFQETLNLRLLQKELTAEEVHRAQELVEEKYAQPGWTERR